MAIARVGTPGLCLVTTVSATVQSVSFQSCTMSAHHAGEAALAHNNIVKPSVSLRIIVVASKKQLGKNGLPRMPMALANSQSRVEALRYGPQPGRPTAARRAARATSVGIPAQAIGSTWKNQRK
jgi:hypothetical protein